MLLSTSHHPVFILSCMSGVCWELTCMPWKTILFHLSHHHHPPTLHHHHHPQASFKHPQLAWYTPTMPAMAKRHHDPTSLATATRQSPAHTTAMTWHINGASRHVTNVTTINAICSSNHDSNARELLWSGEGTSSAKRSATPPFNWQSPSQLPSPSPCTKTNNGGPQWQTMMHDNSNCHHHQVSPLHPISFELLLMPHWFLPDSGHSCGFRYHSSGLYQPKFRNIDIPVLTLEQSPEWTGTEWHWNAWPEWMLKIAKYGKFCIFTWKIVIK